MKQLIDKSLISLSLALLVGCASTAVVVPPSQNNTLNSITKSTAKKQNSYFMQKQFNHFVNDEYMPTVSKNKEIQKKYMDKKVDAKTGEVTYVDRESDSFTLQETADKLKVYIDAKPDDYSKSNVTKLEKMPVIGN